MAAIRTDHRRGIAWTAGLAVAAALLSGSPPFAQEAAAKVWVAGNYSFSDEKGGFAIRAVSGLGTRADPIVIEQELYSASPVTMVIRSVSFLNPERDKAGDLSAGALFLKIDILNAGGHDWVEFQFELQEIEGKASIFSDGLSFDQKRSEDDGIGSSAFLKYHRDFEPYDRLRFTEGKVDVGERADFSFPLTDYTPRPTFYLVEDPRIPFS